MTTHDHIFPHFTLLPEEMQKSECKRVKWARTSLNVAPLVGVVHSRRATHLWKHRWVRNGPLAKAFNGLVVASMHGMRVRRKWSIPVVSNGTADSGRLECCTMLRKCTCTARMCA